MNAARNAPGLHVTILAFCIALFSACTSAASYSTQLSSAAGLAAGAPITYRGLTIGKVDNVTPVPGGQTSVGFTVDADHRALVRQDSIMVLHNQPPMPAALALYDSDPNSPVAQPGMSLRGADNQQQADMMVMGSGMAGLAASIAALNAAMNAGSAATVNTLHRSALATQAFERELVLLQKAAIAAGAKNLAMVNQQAQTLQRQYDQLAKQLAAQGNSAEAQRLKAEMAKLMNTLGATPSPSPSPSTTLTLPKAVPATP